jgi:hypothetical protein
MAQAPDGGNAASVKMSYVKLNRIR